MAFLEQTNNDKIWREDVSKRFIRKATPLFTLHLRNRADDIQIKEANIDQCIKDGITELGVIFMKALKGDFEKQVSQIIALCMPHAKKRRKGKNAKEGKTDRKNAAESIQLFTQHPFITATKHDCFCHVKGRPYVGQRGLHEWSPARQQTRGYICANNSHGFCTGSCIFTSEYIKRFIVALKAMKCGRTKSGFSIYDVLGEFGESPTSISQEKNAVIRMGQNKIGKTKIGKTKIGKTKMGKTKMGKTKIRKNEIGKNQIGTKIILESKALEVKADVVANSIGSGDSGCSSGSVVLVDLMYLVVIVV